jgi:tetratricopeptide (TPR) repeat protein
MRAEFLALLLSRYTRTLRCVHALAIHYRRDGQFEINVPLLEDLMEKQRRICGPLHEDTLNTMHRLALAYDDVGRFADSITLHENYFDALNSVKSPDRGPPLWPMQTFAMVCLHAGELDRAERLLRELLGQIQKSGTPRPSRETKANALALLAFSMLSKQEYADAETLLRETLSVFEKERPDHPQYFRWVSLLGAVLQGQQKYAEAEQLILRGYEGLKQRESTRFVDKHWLADAGQRVVRYYEETNQPEKASAWRAELQVSADRK